MPGSKGNTNSNIEELINKFYHRYPRLARVVSTFKQNPLSGNTMRMMVKGEKEITRDQEQVQALQAPVMWQQNSPIVISHYSGYGSEVLPRYWNTVLPDIKERYGDIARYEHHDAPTPERSMTEYKLATAGRAIQHKGSPSEFWSWFNTIMVDGVQTMDEAYELLDEIGSSVERDVVEEAVEYDVYGEVIWDDIHSLLGKVDNDAVEKFEDQFENGEPVFAMFVNGVQVQPSYDSIVGTIEHIRSADESSVEAQ